MDAQIWRTLIIYSLPALGFLPFGHNTTNVSTTTSLAFFTYMLSRKKTSHLSMIGSETFSLIHRFGLRNGLLIILAFSPPFFLLLALVLVCTFGSLTSPMFPVSSWPAIFGGMSVDILFNLVLTSLLLLSFFLLTYTIYFLVIVHDFISFLPLLFLSSLVANEVATLLVT